MALSTLHHLAPAYPSSIVFLSFLHRFLFPTCIVFVSVFFLFKLTLTSGPLHRISFCTEGSLPRLLIHFNVYFKSQFQCLLFRKAFYDPNNVYEASPCFLLYITRCFSASSTPKIFFLYVHMYLLAKYLFFSRPHVLQTQGPCLFPQACVIVPGTP